MSDTLISWSDKVWNPMTGCDRVSPGCAHCYARELAARYRRNPQMQAKGIYQKDGGPASGPGFGLTLRPEKLEEPLHWKKPQRIFVNSMSDLFHEEVPDEYIAAVFGVMARARQHTFQILTKRIERAEEWIAAASPADCIASLGVTAPECFKKPFGSDEALSLRWPLENVLIGPTVENAAMAAKRLAVAQEIAYLGWRIMVSYEPALGPIDFSPWLSEWTYGPFPGGDPRRFEPDRESSTPAELARWASACQEIDPQFDPQCAFLGDGSGPKGEGFGIGTTRMRGVISWLICGGESGPKRRPFNYEWARSALRQARDAGVPFFMKQDSAFKSEVYDSLPNDLQVREFPDA